MTLLMMFQSYKHYGPMRTVFCALFTLVFCLFAASFNAARADLYTVEGVEVDVTAKNALEAREKAFTEAQVKAYQELRERLVNSDVEAQAGELDAESISFMVKDFEVTKEQLSAKRYKGTYTIRFRPDSFQKQVIEQGQTYSDIPRGAVLVLPFYQSGSQTILWDSANPFLSAWARVRGNGGVMASTVVPVGDIDDVSQVNEYSPLNYDPVKLERMRDRYGANEVSIILASPEISPVGVENLRLSLYSAKIRGPQFAGQMTVQGQAGEAQSVLYDRAVNQLMRRYKSDWKEETAVASADVQLIRAIMNFTSVREWINAKQTLERVPGMQTVRVDRLTPREASVSLSFHGDTNRLSRALQTSGLILGQPTNIYQQQVYRIYRAAPQPYNAPASAPAQNAPGSGYNRSYY